MRKFDDIRDSFMQALAAQNWNDVAAHGTDLLHQNEQLPWVWANRGLAMHQMGFHLDALLNYDRALLLKEDVITFNNKGAVYFDLEKMDNAYECYQQALDLEPGYPQTHMNIGHVHKYRGDSHKAIASYRESITSDPNFADAQMSLAMALIKDGQFDEGWRRFEWRWKTNQLPPRGIKKPQWNGEDLTKKTILVYAEQGLGDIIQFARYASVLAGRFPRCKIIVEGRQPVRRLLETLPEVYAVINVGELVPEVDYVVPMLSLAGILTPNINSIPAFEKEYLLQRRDIETWGRRLSLLFDRQPGNLKVGLCWAGMARASQPMANKVDKLRSATLSNFAGLAAIPGITWVSLQKGPPASQIEKPPVGMTIGDFTEEMYDFYETCCAAANCDLVISVDTAVVHAAASVGVPTWLLSRWDGCWRWFGDREDSPWYPTLRQFVQPAPHDWDGMLKKVAVELTKLVKDKSQPELNLTMAN